MKKILFYSLMITLLAIFNSCSEDPEIWQSSTADFDGNWFVRYDSDTEADPFHAGFTTLFTYNTASDNGNEIWITDEAGFWDYKVTIPVNQGNMTFGSSSEVTSIVDGYGINVIIENGKIIKEAVKLPSGVIADSIYFEIWFEDLTYPDGSPLAKLFVGGHRKTGFHEDDHH